MSRSAALLAFAGVALALAGYELYGFASVHSLLGDYRAFWCAATVAMRGGDPYGAAALSACERAPNVWGLYTAPAGLAVPAPIPPYAVASFVPFALVAFPFSAILWLCLTAIAAVACAVLMSRVLRVSIALPAWCLLLPATVLWLPYGELTPIALLGALLAALGLQQKQNRKAIAGLALLALEPHLAVGAWITTALLVPRMRLWVAAAGALLIGISAALHAGALTEYLRFVLPLHALAEVPRPAQYSATWFSYALGARPHVAIAIGQITYAMFLLAGITGARALLRRWSEPAVLVLAPLAASVIGGTFVHASQIALAVPFAALFALREQGALRVMATVSLAFLAVPWANQNVTAALSIVVVVAVAFVATADRALALRCGLLATIVMLTLLFVSRHDAVLKRANDFPVAQSRGELASASWGRYIWHEQSAVSIGSWMAKAPTWIALLLLVCGTAAIANKQTVRIVRVDQAPIAP